MNITGVWSQGITGENIVVAILDDGLEMDHEDLKENYVRGKRIWLDVFCLLLTHLCLG